MAGRRTHRSAKTGRIIAAAEAEAYPDTTVSEARPRRATTKQVWEVEQAVKRTRKAMRGVDVIGGETTLKLGWNDLIILVAVAEAALNSSQARRILADAGVPE